VAGVFLTLVFCVIHWAVVLPAALVVASPYILVASFFRSSPYRIAVYSYYKRICISFARFWNEGGWGLAP